MHDKDDCDCDFKPLTLLGVSILDEGVTAKTLHKYVNIKTFY